MVAHKIARKTIVAEKHLTPYGGLHESKNRTYITIDLVAIDTGYFGAVAVFS